MTTLTLTICIWLLGGNPTSAARPPAPRPLLSVIVASPTIALVELEEIEVVASRKQEIPEGSLYSLRVRLVENWRGRFPSQCAVAVRLYGSYFKEMKVGDRALLFINKRLDPAATTQIGQDDLGQRDDTLWRILRAPSNEFLPTNQGHPGWLVTWGLDYKDTKAEEDYRRTCYHLIKELAMSADRSLDEKANAMDDTILAPLFKLHADKTRAWARPWTGTTLHEGIYAVRLSPRVLNIVCDYLKVMENYPERFDIRLQRQYRWSLAQRIQTPIEGDQVPEYLRNLPKDDDEAIKQALERFLREYEKDKKDKQ